MNTDPEECNGLVRRDVTGCNLLYFAKDMAGNEREQCIYCHPEAIVTKPKEYSEWETMFPIKDEIK